MFEEEYDCNVILDIAQSNETMFSKIMSDAAPYDIAFPSDYMIGQMLLCDEKGVETPIIKKIKNNPEIKLNEENFDFDPNLISLINGLNTDGSYCDLLDYCVPYFWGSLGIMYNKETLSETQVNTIKEKGWAVLFEQNLLGDAKIGMYASARDSIASALLYKGYSLNTTNPTELAEAEKVLENMSYSAWATDDLKTGVASGKYDVALVYSGDFFDMLYTAYDDEKEITFDMVVPENNNVFFDAMVIPNNSMNTELACKFIDFMLDNQRIVTKVEDDGSTYEIEGVALANASYVGYCPTLSWVKEAMTGEEGIEGITDLPVYDPSNVKYGEIYKYLGTEAYELYDKIYKKVKK
jgi:spermidine/putrescine-binding protein